MRILFALPNPPSLVRVRPFNLIRGLIARGHEVTVATLYTSEEERADIQRLQRDGIRVIGVSLSRARILRNLVGALATGQPLQAAFCRTPALEEKLLAELACNDPQPGNGPASRPDPYDLVHVEHLRAAHYALLLKGPEGQRARHRGRSSSSGSHRPERPIIWDSVDCISHLFEQAAAHSRSVAGRLVAGIDLGRTRRYEGWLAGQFERVLVTSAMDQEALQRLSRTLPSPQHVVVLPNGVDLAYFMPGSTRRYPATILFSGKMSYHANVTAALHLIGDIMPLVWAERPEARVVIAGKDPARELLGAQSKDQRIQVTGAVPDLRPYLQSATLAVSSLVYGAGIQNKVLEALACATPVVASPQAVSALGVSDGEHLLIAGNDSTFAGQILHLLNDDDLARQLGAAGRRYVEAQHDWSATVAQLEGIYQEAIDACR